VCCFLVLCAFRGAAACCDGAVLLRRGVPRYVMLDVSLFAVVMVAMDGGMVGEFLCGLRWLYLRVG